MKRQARQILLAAALAALLPAAAAQEAKVVKKCADCGVVTSVRQIEQKGEGTGLGAVAGGVVGGVVGHQIGSGRGNTVATIAGAAGGAYAGHQVEKNVKKKTSWDVTLQMDNGGTRTFNYSAAPSVREGDHVKLIDGGKRLGLVAP
jgi:outer membrane lipoprotein SlyB